MQKVVLDTNALLMPFEFTLNLDLELQRLVGNCEVYVPGPVIGELKRSRSKFARAALSLARKYRLAETGTQGDEGVIETARKLDAYVVTNDRALRARLIRLRIRTISLRSGRYLELDAP